MKNLYAIYGSDTGPEMEICKNLLDKLWDANRLDYFCTRVETDMYLPEESLARTISYLKAQVGEDYSNFFVLYGGSNLSLFKDGLSCNKLDVPALMNKVIEENGAYDTPEQQEIVNRLFISSLYDSIMENLK